MNLFGYDDVSEEEEGLTEAQIRKKKFRKRLNRPDDEPMFKGKVNLSMKELQKADEVWLVKVPRKIKADRYEGHELSLEEGSKIVLELSNGVKVDSVVEKKKFKLPVVMPKDDKELVSKRVQHGIKAEKAYGKFRDARQARKRGRNLELDSFEDYEEQADTVAIQFKGKITLSRHIDVGKVPDQRAEVHEKVPQPELKRRHPFFGLEEPPEAIAKMEPSSPAKNTRKKRKRT